jgi:hypothetical protein
MGQVSPTRCGLTPILSKAKLVYISQHRWGDAMPSKFHGLFDKEAIVSRKTALNDRHIGRAEAPRRRSWPYLNGNRYILSHAIPTNFATIRF